MSRPLHGACSCGRNQYLIVVPEDSTEHAQVLFDESSEHRRHQASPLTAWLRVPLSWYHSTTYSLYPDETHAAIRRAFTPIHAPHTKRYFCGFCGTSLTYWSEQPKEESEFLSVTLGSLLGEDLRDLEELGLLPEDSLSGNGQGPITRNVIKREEGSESLGLPWFREMIDGSRLGRIGRNQRGGGVSADGRTRVEWEIVEFGDDLHGSDAGIGTAKRKIGEVGEGSGKDIEMGGGT